ncbi:hypothetical protein D3C73_1646750 [compost metagenome]
MRHAFDVAPRPEMHERQAADDQENDDGADLDQGEPELEFAVFAHVHEIDGD